VNDWVWIFFLAPQPQWRAGDATCEGQEPQKGQHSAPHSVIDYTIDIKYSKEMRVQSENLCSRSNQFKAVIGYRHTYSSNLFCLRPLYGNEEVNGRSSNTIKSFSSTLEDSTGYIGNLGQFNF
jgi:hypothetical protein